MFSLRSVMLRPLEPEDCETAYGWHLDNDIEILTGWGERRSRAGFQQKFLELVTSGFENYRSFAIVVGNAPVGRIDLHEIDRGNRTAGLGLFIGAKELWGQGYGTAATTLMVDYAFAVENLEKVHAHVFDFNQRAKRMFLAARFTMEGLLREHEVHNGRRQDLCAFGMLKSEFYHTHPTVFAPPTADRQLG